MLPSLTPGGPAGLAGPPSFWLSVREAKDRLLASLARVGCGVFTVPVALGQESLPHPWGEEQVLNGHDRSQGWGASGKGSRGTRQPLEAEACKESRSPRSLWKENGHLDLKDF